MSYLPVHLVAEVPPRIAELASPLPDAEVRGIAAKAVPLSSHRRLGEHPDQLAQSEEPSSCADVAAGLLSTHSLLVSFVLAIALAAVAPSIGLDQGPIRAQYSISYGATMLIFLLLGLSLELADVRAFASRSSSVAQLISLQTHSLCLVPLMVWPIAALLRDTQINPHLISGLVVLSCLPTTISTCVVLTVSSAGTELLAVAMATVGNTLGVLLAPLSIALLLHSDGAASLGARQVGASYADMLVKVFLPLGTGVALRAWPDARVSTAVRANVKAYKAEMKRAQETLLALVVYRTFCVTFTSRTFATAQDLFAVFTLDALIMCLSSALSWAVMSVPVLGFTDRDRVAGLFSSTHKTIALGIPLINTMFNGSPHVGLIAVPLLIYHPMQVLVGSVLSPALKSFAEQSEPAAVSGADAT